MARPPTITFTADGFTLTHVQGLTLTLPATTLLIHTDAGPIHLTRHGLQPSSLTEIQNRQGQRRTFHPMSTGASVADYLAYVMTLEPGPHESRTLTRLLEDHTAAGHVPATTLHTSLVRDARFTKLGRGLWDLAPTARTELDAETVDDVIPTQPAPTRLTHQLDTHLRGHPTLRRTLHVPADATLLDMHHALQLAYGWKDQHLNQFSIGDHEYEARTWEPTLGEGALDAATAQVSDVLPLGTTGTYLYDWSARWRVDFRVTGVLLVPAHHARLQCVSGAEAPIPEQMFGEDTYQKFLHALLKHPGSTLGKQAAAALGRDFDPAAFDLTGLNTQLQRRFP